MHARQRLTVAAAGLLVLFAASTRCTASANLTGMAYKGWDVRGFEVHGLDHGLTSRLKAGLALAGQSKILWTEHPPFSPEMLQEDLHRAQLFLARSGYPKARITPRFAAVAEKRRVTVHFDVEPGAAVLFGQASVEAIPPPLAPRARRILQLEPGEVFTDDGVEARLAALLQLLQGSGYAKARVTTTVTPVDSSRVDVAFVVDAGSIYFFGNTVVTGAEADLVGVVRRSAAIRRGARYRPTSIERATESLRILDLFRRVQVTTRETAGDTLDVVCDVAPRKPRSVQVGVGYWTEDQARASVDWTHRNLLAKGRGGSIDGTYSRYEQTASVSLWKPTLFKSRTRGVLTLRGRRDSEVSYKLLGAELEASATYVATWRTTLRPALTVSYIDLQTFTTSLPAFTEPDGRLTTLSLTWTRDTLNDKLDPHRGTSLRAYGEWGLPGVLSQNHYLLGDVEDSTYRTLVADVVMVARARFSAGAPLGGTPDLLPNKRFYAGGTSSMRGFRRNFLGPIDAARTPLGGDARVEGSLEVRVPLIGRLDGAVFLDAGQVWLRRDQIRWADLALATGPGLILRTPLGPVRADVGFPFVGREAGEPRAVFHLSVGHLF